MDTNNTDMDFSVVGKNTIPSEFAADPIKPINDEQDISKRSQAIRNLVYAETHGTDLSDADKDTLGISRAIRVGTPLKKSQQEAETWLNSYWAKQIEAEKERERKRIEGESLGRSIGDFANVIGDMIQGWNGAPVTPRDVQKKYDSLTEQQQKAYDNYFARMDALRKQIEEKEKADKAARDKWKLEQYKAQTQDALLDKKLQTQLKINENNKATEKAIADIRASAATNAAAIRSNNNRSGGGSGDKSEEFDSGEHHIKIPANSVRSRYNNAYNKLKTMGKIGDEQKTNVFDQRRNIVLEYLESESLTTEQRKELVDILNGVVEESNISNGNPNKSQDDDRTMPGVLKTK